jgi:hypothetical protein
LTSASDYVKLECADHHGASDGAYYMDEMGNFGDNNGFTNTVSSGNPQCKICPAGYECLVTSSTGFYESKTRCMPHLDVA